MAVKTSILRNITMYAYFLIFIISKICLIWDIIKFFLSKIFTFTYFYKNFPLMQ